MGHVNASICVFMGSRRGARAEYAAAARQLGRELVARGYARTLTGRRLYLSAGPDPQFFFCCPPFVDYPNPPAAPVKAVNTDHQTTIWASTLRCPKRSPKAPRGTDPKP